MSHSARIGMVASLLVALAGCGGGGGDSALPVSGDALGTTLSSSISSAQTGIAYDLDIWVPPGYAQATTSYPVIYAMDCEYRFATLMAVLQQSRSQTILVNVCAMGSARRWVDFTMPGAAPYYRFLTLELIPFFEARYRANPANRILSGHSLSGEFVLYALYMEDPAHRYFTSIVSEECSCWYDASMSFSQQLAQPIAMEQAMYDADHRLPVNLVMAGDTFSNEPDVLVVYNTIAARHYQGLRTIQPTYSLGHVQMDGPAFADALSFIFAGP
jgi:hypothetical protein